MKRRLCLYEMRIQPVIKKNELGKQADSSYINPNPSITIQKYGFGRGQYSHTPLDCYRTTVVKSGFTGVGFIELSGIRPDFEVGMNLHNVEQLCRSRCAKRMTDFITTLSILTEEDCLYTPYKKLYQVIFGSPFMVSHTVNGFGLIPKELRNNIDWKTAVAIQVARGDTTVEDFPETFGYPDIDAVGNVTIEASDEFQTLLFACLKEPIDNQSFSYETGFVDVINDWEVEER